VTTVHDRPVFGPPGHAVRLASPAARPALALRLVRGFALVDTGLATLVLIMFVTVYVIQSRPATSASRLDDQAAGVAAVTRPASGDAAGLDVLLVAMDRRSGGQPDVVAVLHVDADGDGSALVTIPHAARVPVPGHGTGTLDGALSHGPLLAVAAVERLTGLGIDHTAVVDPAGFDAIVETVGSESLPGPVAGYDALRAVLRESLTRATATPLALYRLLDDATRHARLDAGWSVGQVRALLLDLHRLDTVTFVAAPVKDAGWNGSRVALDLAAQRGLWREVRRDRAWHWVAEDR
jgi:hypothetical protein